MLKSGETIMSWLAALQTLTPQLREFFQARRNARLAGAHRWRTRSTTHRIASATPSGSSIMML